MDSATFQGVFLRGAGGAMVPVPGTALLRQSSQYWTYVVGNRTRFTEDTRGNLQAKALKDLERMGVPAASLDSLIQGNIIEASMPYEREDVGWEYRICPWESLLSLATKPRRKPDQHLTVVRHLRRAASRPAAPPPAKLLLVVSAPGRLRGLFDFTLECQLVADALAFGGAGTLRLNNPTREELQAFVAEHRPEVIHLAGVDAHQKAALLGEPDDPLRHDGFVLRGADGKPEAVGAEDMGAALTAGGGHSPRLVAFNCYNSGARLAALTVAAGAASAIGFQDTIDDAVAEQLFANFYSVWRQSRWSRLLEAFTLSRQQVADTVAAVNTGDLVLWNDTSVFATTQAEVLADWTQVAARAFRSAQPWLKALKEKLAESAAPPPPLAVPPPKAPKVLRKAAIPPAAPPKVPVLTVDARPLESLNYSLLHNRRSPFKRFQIVAAEDDLPAEIEIRVQLWLGDNALPIRCRRRLVQSVTPLHEELTLPLIAPMLRGQREGISTILAVEVLCGGQSVHCASHPVRLRPADEWTDEENDKSDQRWLPSFILPRDPAVQRIVEGAQRYLRALADDSGAGFDGYQRVADPGEDPQAVVDQQVRALWSALLYEHPVSYINPPPTYTPGAQRIRTPSQILEGRRGTCIDLALLFAACLEYLGLMPVMFLTPGHAFPGYWRSETARDDFKRFDLFRDTDESQAPNRINEVCISGRVAPEGWMVVGLKGLEEIMNAIQCGGLVPVETTEITRRGSFRSAQDLGVKNLITPWGFEAMVEIQRARDDGVTPLPLLNQEV